MKVADLLTKLACGVVVLSGCNAGELGARAEPQEPTERTRVASSGPPPVTVPATDVAVSPSSSAAAASTSGKTRDLAALAGKPQLRLTILLDPQGFVLKTSAGNVAPGCKKLGTGVTIPPHKDGPDFAALRSCATRIKRTHPKESKVTLTAKPSVSYRRVIRTMDALRETSAGTPLFPDVHFGVAP